MYSKLILGWLMLWSIVLKAQKVTTPQEYIEAFKDIAIEEMNRSGIPASITLAQGIHESAYGTSKLAVEAKNHFGIKCTSDWKGKTYRKWDDEKVQSCFRVYKSAEESYRDHTDFLVNRKHYRFLFDYDSDDYTSWAKGLRKAGYATDPKYPQKLIKTIELYKLDQYDKTDAQNGEIIVFDPTDTPKEPENPSIYIQPEPVERPLRRKPASFLFTEYKKGIYRQNGANYVTARKEESPLDVSIRFGIPYNKLLKFNDLVDGDHLMRYQYVYISPKKATYRGEETFHKVENDQTMYEIAQYYGVKLDDLLKRNLLKEGEEPKNGETILLAAEARKKPSIRPKNHQDRIPKLEEDETNSNNTTFEPVANVPKIERPEPQEVEVNTPVYNENIYTKKDTLNTVSNKDSIPKIEDIEIDTDTSWLNEPVLEPTKIDSTITDTDNEPKVNPNAIFTGSLGGTGSTDTPKKNDRPKTTTEKPTPTEKPKTNDKDRIHTVKSGETLYRLSVKYGVTVEEIKAANDLTNNTISLNQKLKIPSK